jgi:hypothetical protein
MSHVGLTSSANRQARQDRLKLLAVVAGDHDHLIDTRLKQYADIAR